MSLALTLSIIAVLHAAVVTKLTLWLTQDEASSTGGHAAAAGADLAPAL